MPTLVNPYFALDWQRAPFYDYSRVMLLTGSAGGGKSKCAAEKVIAFLKRYHNATGVVVRKTRSSMSNSTLLFLERNILGADNTVHHAQSHRRFEFPNGSVLAYGGMQGEEQREQLRSIGQDGAVDIAWMEEANKFEEDDFNELLARLRGRAAPWRQIILSTNPDASGHWIYRRLIMEGEASVHFSKAVDNPYNPAGYQETLESLSGVLKQRLAEGLWVQAEGLVYSQFDAGRHVVDAFEIPREWKRYRSIDFGYWPSPFVCQWWARDPDDNLYLYRELYLSKHRVRELAEMILAYSGREVYEWSCSDHDAESAETLAERGVATANAGKDFDTGLQLVMERLEPPDKGAPRLFFMRGALIQEDPALLDQRRPTSTLDEITLYAWPEKLVGLPKERPVKAHDHGMDAMRYLVTTLDRGWGVLGDQHSKTRPVTAGMRKRTF